MPTNEKTNEILRSYSGDVLELHRHFLDMLKDEAEQEEVQRYPSVQHLVTRTQDTVSRHLVELEQGLQALGGEGSSWLKQAMSSAAGAAMGMFSKVDGSEKCSKVLRNNFVALDAATLGSLMLYITAEAFNENRIGEMSARHFDALASLATETSDLIPEMVVSEFADEGYSVNRSVIEEANRKMQQAWTGRAARS